MRQIAFLLFFFCFAMGAIGQDTSLLVHKAGMELVTGYKIFDTTQKFGIYRGHDIMNWRDKSHATDSVRWYFTDPIGSGIDLNVNTNGGRFIINSDLRVNGMFEFPVGLQAHVGGYNFDIYGAAMAKFSTIISDIDIIKGGHHQSTHINGNTAGYPLILNGGDSSTNSSENVLIGTATDVASSKLTVNSTTQGVLITRGTDAQMRAIASPANGLLFTNTDSLNRVFIWTGTAWRGLSFTNEQPDLSSLVHKGGEEYITGNKHFTDTAFFGARVGIGTQNTADSNYKLFVETGIRTRKIKVDALTWSDYVFDNDYKLPTLVEVERFIQHNKHLPGVQSAAEVEKNGIDLAENSATLLKKIEELTLYMIELSKRVASLAKENELLKEKIATNK